MAHPVSISMNTNDGVSATHPLLNLIDLLGPNPRGNLSGKPSYDLSDYYGNNSHVEGQIRMYSAFRNEAMWINEISPLVRTKAERFFTVSLEFDPAWADDVAPRGPSRVALHREKSSSFTLGRKGLGIQAPVGWHESARGQMIWERQLDQIKVGMEDTFLLETMERIFSAPPALIEQTKEQILSISETEYIKNHAQSFAFLQKAKSGYTSLLPHVKNLIAIQGGDFDAIITNDEVQNFLALVPKESVENLETAKTNSSALLLIKYKLNLGMATVYIFPPINTDTHDRVDIFKSREQVGNHEFMFNRYWNTPNYLYDARHETIEVWDEDERMFNRYELPTAIKQSGIGMAIWDDPKFAAASNAEVREAAGYLRKQTFSSWFTYLANHRRFNPKRDTFKVEYIKTLADQITLRSLGESGIKTADHLRSLFRNEMYKLTTTAIQNNILTRTLGAYAENPIDQHLLAIATMYDAIVAVIPQNVRPFTLYEFMTAFINTDHLQKVFNTRHYNMTDVGYTAALHTYPVFVQELIRGGSVQNRNDFRDVKGVVTALLDLIQLDQITLEAFVRNNWPSPIAYIAARPHGEFIANAMVFLMKNQGTLTRYRGTEHFTFNQNGIEQTHQGHLTVRGGTHVHNTKNLMILPAAHLSAYDRGNNCIPFEFGKAGANYYAPNNRHFGENNECSVFFFAIPACDVQAVPNPMCITGYHRDQLAGLNLFVDHNEVHYPTAPAYALYWGFPKTSGDQYTKIKPFERIDRCVTNLITWRGATRIARPNNNSTDAEFNIFMPETGPFEGITHEESTPYRYGGNVHTSDIYRSKSVINGPR